MKKNVSEAKKDFPIFERHIRNNKKLIYLDSAATTLKPKSVVARISEHYLYETSNVHRGLHFLSDQATEFFESSRKKVAQFINSDVSEVIFTKGTTDSINLVARSFCSLFKKNDSILISEIEHHSNIVPWQEAAIKYGLKLETFKVNQDGTPDLADYKKKLEGVKLVSITAVSNTLGVEFPVLQMIREAHFTGAKVLIDAAQAVAHKPIDVKKWDCDFLVFSAHKLYGPTGIGVLFGKKDLLNEMPPFEVGGGMIDQVTFEKTTFLPPPFRFEAGTPHIAGAIGLMESINYISQFSFEDILDKEKELTTILRKKLRELDEVTIYGDVEASSCITSFYVKGENPSDVGSMLDNDGIAVRAGHHCTQPLMKKLGIPGTVRASLAIYNDEYDIETFILSLKKVIKILKA